MSKLKIDLFRDSDCFKHLNSEWNILLSRSRSDTIFLTKEWQRTWWKIYGNEVGIHLLTMRDDDGTLVGIVPLQVTKPDGEKTVIKFIGENDISDYLDLIIARGREHEVYEAIVEYITNCYLPWEEIELYPLPPLSLAPEVLGYLAMERGFDVSMEKVDVCPFLELTSTWDDYLGLLEGKTRHEIRRKIRKAEREYNISIHEIRNSPGIDGPMESFFYLLEHSNDPEKAEFLSRDGMKDFFLEMVRVFLKKGWIVLYFLRIDGVDAASMMCFHYNSKSFLYNSGYNPRYSSVSPGIVLLCHCIQEAIRKGLKRFEFLRGGERYKFNFGARPSYTLRMRIRR